MLRRFDSYRGRFFAALGFLVLAGWSACAAKDAVEARARKEAEERLRKDIGVLASDELEGRGVATEGIHRAADYIAEAFKKAGLKPAGKDGYFQPFTMPGAVLEKDKPNTLRLSGPKDQVLELKLGEDFLPLGMSHSGTVKAPVVFVGYGAITSKEFGYDDYDKVDVAGKVVIVLRDTPRAGNQEANFDGLQRKMHASFDQKIDNALTNQAAAILFVNDQESAKDGDAPLAFSFLATAPSRHKIPSLHVRRGVVDKMLQTGLGKPLKEIEQEIDKELKPRSAPLEGWTAELTVNVQRGSLQTKNVIGVLEGAGPLAKETIVIGAHYDHLGLGGMGSRASAKKPAIHHGADDNGSGTTVLLELARRFGEIRERQGRRLIFIAFTAEESGLLGSAYYCKNPPFPLEDTVAMINMDMVGRLRPDTRGRWSAFLALTTPVPDFVFPVLPLALHAEGKEKYDNLLQLKDKLALQGTGTAKNFNALIDALNRKYNFRLQKSPGGFGPSDHSSFCGKKIPVLFLFTGEHADYHRPDDTADKINVEGLRKIADFLTDVVTDLAQAPQRPEYVKVGNDALQRPAGKTPRIGVRPEMGDDGEGMLIGGVTEGGPAAKAGLKDGDRIIAIGDQPVKNLTGYMTILGTKKAGETLEFTILRNGEKIKVKVTPEQSAER